MRTAVASALVLTGAVFMLAAALGVVRFPDLYTRMQAATKAATVGVAGVMCGVAVAASSLPVTVRALLVSAFFLLTAPVAAHAIARSAHTRGVPLAGVARHELEGRRRRVRAAGGRGGPGARETPRARAASREGPGMHDHRP